VQGFFMTAISMSSAQNNQTLVVIGGGAAGFFCAINAARMNPALQVILLEKSNKLLSKVKVSGGGRCNVTHACFDIREMVAKYPRGANFLKKAFHQFFTTDTIEWFQERGVTLKTEADGRMFPTTNSSQTIIDCLLREANLYHIDIRLNSEVTSITRHHDIWQLQLNNRLITAQYVCVAAGGYPKSSMYQWLQQTGHTIETPRPSLFTFNIPTNPITQLMGVAVEFAQVKIAGTKLVSEGPLLITHWGLSGPAVLKVSAYGARLLADKDYHFTAIVNWSPSYTEHSLREDWQQLRLQLATTKIANKNPFKLPQRLWEYILLLSGISIEIRWAELPAKAQNILIKNITAQEFVVKGKTTFKEEFVTAGGIILTEIDVHTMESKIAPNLFFAGENIDVDGVTGGFNFQNAWTTGWIAANAIASKTIQ
jgi:predicted Rossmann fold flavoprotein